MYRSQCIAISDKCDTAGEAIGLPRGAFMIRPFGGRPGRGKKPAAFAAGSISRGQAYTFAVRPLALGRLVLPRGMESGTSSSA